jgi:hypothetical protein
MSRRTGTKSKLKKYLLSCAGSLLFMFMQFLLQTKFGIQPATPPAAIPADHELAAPQLRLVETPAPALPVGDRAPVYNAPVRPEPVGANGYLRRVSP